MEIKYSEPATTNPAKFKQYFKSEEFPILSAYQEINELFWYCEYAISIPKYISNYNINEKFKDIKKNINNMLFGLMMAKYFKQINLDIKSNFINICKIIQKN